MLSTQILHLLFHISSSSHLKRIEATFPIYYPKNEILLKRHFTVSEKSKKSVFVVELFVSNQVC